MKIITYSKVGYNHPSQANWAWGIWKIDLIDTKDQYCMSHTVKENFGGESRLRAKVKEELNTEMIETKGVYTSTATKHITGVYTSTATPKVTGVSSMWNAEGEEIIKEIKNFLKK